MKLYNKTKYPNELLEPLLKEAGKAVGARTTNVIVKVTQGRYRYCRGMAHKCGWVKKWFLDTRAHRKGGVYLKEGMVGTDGGYFTLTMPNPFIPDWVKNSEHFKAWSEAHNHDGLTISELIYSVASHEWQHINQYQENKFSFYDKGERAKHHDNRVWEKDAIKASNKATAKPKDKAQESILNMALWIENNK
jgi:hypothetical protein